MYVCVGYKQCELFIFLKQLYSRVAGILLAVDELSSSSAAMQAVLNVFATDSSLQPLLPYFSRFFYSQVKANSRRLPLLRAVIRSDILPVSFVIQYI